MERKRRADNGRLPGDHEANGVAARAATPFRVRADYRRLCQANAS